MGKLDGKVAFITGAARGQGRAHAVAMAREGADIVALDVCKDLSYPRYSLATREDLNETVARIEAQGRKALAIEADVSRASEMEAAAKLAIATFGWVDIVVCNAGIADMALAWDITEEWWDIMLAVNLKGCWLTVKYLIPRMIERKAGGRIIMTSSVAGLRGEPGMAHYCASKWGVIGLAKSLAHELSQYHITVNTLNPTGVNTDLITGMAKAAEMAKEDLVDFISSNHLLPVELVEVEDVANAVLWLASDESRYVTGQAFQVDAGRMLK